MRPRTSSGRRATRRVGVLALVVLATGCIDFGSVIERPEAFADASAGDAGPVPAVDAGPENDASHEHDAGPGDDAGSADGGGCVEGVAEPSAEGPQVRFVTLNVDSPVLVIDSGDVVTFTNTDTERHTVTAGAPGAVLPPARGGFDSGEIDPSRTWAYRFCDPRTILWFCSTHAEQMNGYRIIVE